MGRKLRDFNTSQRIRNIRKAHLMMTNRDKAKFIYPSDSALPWTPSEITTVAWYDASDETTITSALGSASKWDDIGTSGTEHLTQGIEAQQPATGTRTHNGLNVLDFDGFDRMNKTSFPVPVSGDIAVFMVAGFDVINNAFDCAWSMDAANDYQFESFNNTQFLGRINTNGIGVGQPTLTGGPFPGPSIYNLNFDFTGLSSLTSYIDGIERLAALGTYTTKLSTSQNFRIFANRGDNSFPDGFVGEIVIVEDCSEACRQQIEGYLAHKWGLQANLPAGHPYKSSAPTV